MKKFIAAALVLVASCLSSYATTALKVTWVAATPAANSSGIQGYNVYRSTGTCSGTPTNKIGSTTTNTYFDTTTSASTTYCYTVAAFDESGREGPKATPQNKTSLADATVNAASNSSVDVQTAVDNANDGDEVVVPSGTVTWASPILFSNLKGVTLRCATPGACHVTSSSQAVGMNFWSSQIDKFYRVTGFDFNSPLNNGFIIWFCRGGGCTGNLTNLRFDHNTFECANGCVGIFLGENTSTVTFYGVIDHNTITGSGSVMLYQAIGGNSPNPPNPPPLGTANNMFIEDNTVSVTTTTDASFGCMDGWGGNDIVWRHNTTTNCLGTSHGVTHAGGPQNHEIYNNSWIVTSGMDPAFVDCTRCFHHQGSGTIVGFNNQFTQASGQPHSTDPFGIADYRAYVTGPSIDGGAPTCDGTVVTAFQDGGVDANRSTTATYRGYPCWHQAGRDFAPTPAGGRLSPIYCWGNTWTDNNAQASCAIEQAIAVGTEYTAEHFVTDRDIFNAVSASSQSSPTSPFNGTTGMGFGTLANRPTTCSTAATDAGDSGFGGVGYFATDKGPQGTLYNCGNSNKWTIHYQPYSQTDGVTPSGRHPLTAIN